MGTTPRLSRALIVLSALALAACAGAEGRKSAFLAQGQKHMAERNWQKARVDFRNALQVDPKDAQVIFNLGAVSERLGDYVAAAGAYQQALNIDKGRLDARRGLARLYARGGAPKDAVALVEEGLLQHPDDATLLAIRGIARDQLGDASAALADGEAAARLAAGDSTAGMLLGVLYLRAGRLDDAVAAVERASAAHSDDVELQLQLAEIYRAAGRPAAAADRLRRAIALEPGRLELRKKLAESYILSRDIDAAEKVLREAIAAMPLDVDAKLSLATLLATHRSFEDGERSLKTLVSADPSSHFLRMSLGRFYESSGRTMLAADVYREVSRLDAKGPQGIAARGRLAAMEWSTGNVEAARDLVDGILAENSRDNDALALRARIALSRGDATAAISDLRAILRDQPNAPGIMRALAEAYVAANEAALAEETLRASVQANPTDVPSRLALSQYLLKGGRAEEAQAAIDQLSADLPRDIAALEAALRVQVGRRDFAAARATAARAVALWPDQPRGYYLSGLVDEVQGRRAEALAGFEKALSLAPDSTEPLVAAVRADLALKQPARAAARVDAVLARTPKSAQVHNLRGELDLQLVSIDSAISAFNKAIELQPGWWLPYRNLGRAHFAAGRAEKAIAAYQRGLAATQYAPNLLVDLAEMQERAGKTKEAVALYEEFLRRNSGSPIARNNLAMLLLKYHAGDQASLDRAMELARPLRESSQPALLDTYAWVCFARGEYAEAVAVLTRVVQLAPGTPVFAAHLGLAHFKAGQRAEAKKYLQLAIAGGGATLAEADQVRAALAQL